MLLDRDRVIDVVEAGDALGALMPPAPRELFDVTSYWL